MHILTPETEKTTHYNFAATRWNIRPDSETAEMREKISSLRRFAFAEQDEPMLAAQAKVWEVAGPERTRPVWLDIDVGIARWRKLVEQRLEAEGHPRYRWALARGGEPMIDVETRLDVLALYADYAACLDEARMDDWPGFFTEDAHYRLVPRENHDRGLPLATVDLVGTGDAEGPGVRRDQHALPRALLPAARGRTGAHPRRGRRADPLPRRATSSSAPSAICRARCSTPGATWTASCGPTAGLRFREKICVFDSELISTSIIYPI